ncbi:hypothetical protein FRC11_005466, partial [Ceratobasidium sp. 423]
DETGKDNGQAPSQTLDKLDMSKEELDDIFISPMVPGSKDEKELLGAKKGLYKATYLEKAKWREEWIEHAQQPTYDVWSEYYKPESFDKTEDTNSQSNFGYSTYIDEVFGPLAEEQEKPVNPITAFVNDKIVIKWSKSGSKCPVNPLAWWYAQHLTS